MGLPGLAVGGGASPEPSCTSHVQREPNRLTPLSLNCALKSSNEPKAASIAARRSPSGSPPPLGDIHSQNFEWLEWPPAWLRTPACLSLGSLSRFLRTSSTGLSAHSVPSSRPLAAVT